MTDRELLANALESVAETEADKKALRSYKKKVSAADELDKTLTELEAKKKALTEAKAKAKEIREVQDEIIKTKNRITNIDNALFKLESTIAMKLIFENKRGIFMPYAFLWLTRWKNYNSMISVVIVLRFATVSTFFVDAVII